MNAPKEAFDSTVSYLRICALGSVFIVAYNVIGGVFRGLGDSKTPLTTVAIACVANIIGDLILVGIFNMGATGAALATIIAQAISVILSLVLVQKRGLPFDFSLKSIKFHKDLTTQILKFGTPIALQGVLVNFSFLVVVTIGNGMGLVASAGMGVAQKLVGFIMLVPLAFSQAVSAFVAQNYGAKKYDRAIKTLKISMIANTIIFVIGFILTQFTPELLVGVFNRDPELMGLTINGLRKYTLAIPIIGVSIVGTSYIQSIGKAKMAMLLSLLRQVIILIPLIAILPIFFGVDGAWFAQPIADIIASVVTGTVLFKEVKKYSKIKEEDELIEEVKAV
jgi:putative MATE family efflux protein